MNLFDRMSQIPDDTDSRLLPKGNYVAVIESAVLQNHPSYGDNINWAFRLVETKFGAGRKVFSTNYLDPPTDATKKDPIWKLKKNLSGLGVSKEDFPKTKEELLTILEAAVDQQVVIAVTTYASNGRQKNDATIVGLNEESETPTILKASEEKDLPF